MIKNFRLTINSIGGVEKIQQIHLNKKNKINL
jgi:hypothetical protein